MKKISNNLKIGIVLGFAVIILLVFEIVLYNRKGQSDGNKELQNQVVKLQSTTVYSEQKEVYGVVNSIVELMNKKEYNKLYSMLKEDYKNYLFPEYEGFEEYIKKYAACEYVPQYSSYYRDGDKYIIITSFLRKEYTRDELVNGTFNKYDIITLQKVGENDYKFALGNFVETTQNNITKQVDDLEITLLRTTRYAETTKVMNLFSNNSDKKIYIDDTNIQIISDGNVSVVSSFPITAINPGESLVVTIEFYLKYDSYKEFKGCTFSGIKNEDGKVFEDVTIKV